MLAGTAAVFLGCSLSGSPAGGTVLSGEDARYVTTGYELLWADEFNAGTQPDGEKWNYDIGNGVSGWGNNELEYYTDRTDNVRIENGMLQIISLKEKYNRYAYTSGRINTKGKFSFTYGKVVARIALSEGDRTGIWPAFWMLGSNIDEVGWPQCGETDVMENVGEQTTYTTLHWWNETAGAYASFGTATPGTVNEFHDYEVEWGADSVIGRIDGVTVFTRTLDSTMTEFREPFYLILNQAVGGNWPGKPSRSTVFPSTMYVDYVRVYQKAP